MRLAVAALAVLLIGCDPRQVEVARQVETTPGEADRVSDAERPALEAAAAGGDWQAAQRLALDRVWVREKMDAEAARLWRLWAAGDEKAHAGLATLLLVRSCDPADLTEVIEINARLNDVLNVRERSGLAQTRNEAALLLSEGRVAENCYDLR
ncbi:MAG: hypothetical protein ABL871_18245 [Terricaulis sp.]